MSVAVDQLHRLRGLGRHDRALTSSLAPPGGSTEATKERLICSQIELATDGAILLRQDGRASWASFHGKSDGRRVFTVEFKRGELERLLGQEADGDRDSAGGAGGCKEKSAVAQRVRTVTQHPVAAICRTLRMARQTAHYATRVRPAGFYRRLDDETVVQQIRGVTAGRVFPDATRHRLSPEHVVAHGFQSCRRNRSISTTVQVHVRY